MSDSDKSQALFESFASGFLRSLLEGQRVQLARPLGHGLLDHFAVAGCAESEVDEAIYAKLHARMAEHAPVRALAYPCRETRAFAMAVHDLLVLTDPLLDRAFSRRARPKIVRFVEELIEAAGAPRTRGETLARHVILSAALRLKRTDVVVKNWAYTYRFFGRPVPHNVVMLPRLRMVRQTQEEQGLLAILNELDDDKLPTRKLLEAVILRSPCTHIMQYELSSAPLFDLSTLTVLSDPSLRQSLISELCEAHREPMLMTRLGDELWKLRVRRDVPARLLRIGATFVLELALHLMLRRDAPDFGQATQHFEFCLALCLPEAAASSPGPIWPVLSRADDERARFAARNWVALAGEVALREAENVIAEATA